MSGVIIYKIENQITASFHPVIGWVNKVNFIGRDINNEN